MIEKFLGQIGQSTLKHLFKNASKYVIGGVTIVIARASYVIGHKDGKKEGTNEQAKRDEDKFKQQEKAHNQDRKKWEKQKEDYEDLLNDVEQNF